MDGVRFDDFGKNKKNKRRKTMNKSEGYLKYVAEECAKKILSFGSEHDLFCFVTSLGQKAAESHFVTLADASVLRDAVIKGSSEEVVQAMETYGWESYDILARGEIIHSTTPKDHWALWLPSIKKFHRGYSSKNKNNTAEKPRNHNAYGISLNKDVNDEGKESYNIFITSSNLVFLNRVHEFALAQAKEFMNHEGV